MREFGCVAQQVVQQLPEQAWVGVPASGQVSAGHQQQSIAAGPHGRRMADQHLLEKIDAIEVSRMDEHRAIRVGPVSAKRIDQPAQLSA
jgi:hypothetical protein